MKKLSLLIVLLLVAHASLAAGKEKTVTQKTVKEKAGKETAVFGPVKYDVKARYGKENRYKETFKASEGLYMIQLQNGEQWSERSDLIEFFVNGEKMLRDDKYEQRFIACFVNTQKENSFELVLKDYRPTGLRRPPATPKFVTISVVPAPANLKSFKGVFGAGSREALMDYLSSIQKIKTSETAALASSAINLQNDVSARAGAVRKISDVKDKDATDFLVRMFSDLLDKTEVRAEAALAIGLLGDTKNVPALIQGVQDPEETLRIASARALSFYKEDDTRESLRKLLTTLDSMRKSALMHAIVNAGWKPVGVLIELMESTDPQVSSTAIDILGGIADTRALEPLLKLLGNPGNRDIRLIITALGNMKDGRALEPLLQMARDPAKRAGIEPELGDALANFGDQRAADAIKDMANSAKSPYANKRLRDAYKRLTGKDL